MRIVKILLLSLLLLNTNLSAAENSTDVALYKIIKNGWSEDNKTLNEEIISYYEKKRPKILKCIKEPFKDTKLNKFGLPELPELVVTYSDYLYIEAYTKYLEKEGKYNESLKINIEILKGLNNTKDDSFVSLIMHIKRESLVRDSLFELIRDNKNFKISKRQFNEIKENLILDKKLLIKVVKQDQNISIKYTEITLKYINRRSKKPNSSEFLKSIEKETNRQKQLFFKKVFVFIEKGTPEATSELKKDIKNFIQENKCKSLESFDNDKLTITTKEKTVKMLLCTTTAGTLTDLLFLLHTDYIKTLKENKLLLDRLKLRVK